jgi:(E)-4-hydroxy-3-methylbut-2-enyl-diphosphate synthase
MRKVVVKIGNLKIGGDNRIAIQTMCNTSTTDIEKTVSQCIDASVKGADIIRLTTQGVKQVDAMRVIKQTLRANGITIPIVADVHYSHKVAQEAAKVADKVRINPGNFAKDHVTAQREFEKLVAICKYHNTAIRIGVNHGSLGERITRKYGNTPVGMSEAAIEWIKMAEELSFDQIVVSLKASNTLVMYEAFKHLHKEMVDNKILYPLHLGVTEAGNGLEGRVKSAVGLASLLKEGIGDTIRVSLTENPVNEISPARLIVSYSTSGDNVNSLPKHYECNTLSELAIKISCDYGPLLLKKEIDNFNITASINGKQLSDKDINNLKDIVLQASRRKFTKPEYIACPGCGRTLFNLEKAFEEVKQKTAHLTGYNIAVMGCIVNGPGEMADADYGYVGEGAGKVSIYRGKERVFKSVPQEDAVDKLLYLIDSDARSKDGPLHS